MFCVFRRLCIWKYRYYQRFLKVPTDRVSENTNLAFTFLNIIRIYGQCACRHKQSEKVFARLKCQKISHLPTQTESSFARSTNPAPLQARTNTFDTLYVCKWVKSQRLFAHFVKYASANTDRCASFMDPITVHTSTAFLCVWCRLRL